MLVRVFGLGVIRTHSTRIVGCILTDYYEESIAPVVLGVQGLVDRVVVGFCDPCGLTGEIARSMGVLVVEGGFCECLDAALNFNPIFVLTFDDGEGINSEDVQRLLSPLETGDTDVVVGRNIGTSFSRCVFRAYSRDSVDFLVSNDGSFDQDDALMILEESGFRVLEVPLTDVMVNPVSWGFVNNVMDLDVFDRPMLLGLPGLFSILVGLVSLFWLYRIYFKTGTLNPSLLFLGGMTLILGILCIFTALILSALKNRRDETVIAYV